MFFKVGGIVPAYLLFLVSMIINTQQNNVQTFGDIKKFKTGIDPKNLEFITTLLSSNLYSHPEQSFIREIVSNAWDSHVEAKNTDTPVIIRLKKNSYSDYSITIRDYGVGLSPERFETIFCNIGSSTKRDSNDYIGAFGIGRFSALSCSNSVYITSYYNGTEYHYIMVKSGNCITTNLVLEKPTEEKNGVEITIRGVHILDKYIEALDYIVFFPNIYIDSAFHNSINTTKIKRFTNFAAANISIRHKLLLGNVLYPLDKTILSNETREFIDNINNTGIVVSFNVGELDITPNRESIIYTSSTIKKIEDRIIQAKREIEGLIDKKITKDYDDIIEYYNAMSKLKYYDPIEEAVTSFCGNGYPFNYSDSTTFKDIKLKERLDDIRSIIYLTPPTFKGAYIGEQLCVKNLPYNENFNKFNCKKIALLDKDTRLVPSLKRFLRDYYYKHSIIIDFDIETFKKYVDSEIPYIKEEHKDLIIESVYNSFMNKAIKVDYLNDQRYKDIKEELSTKGKNLPEMKEIILRVSSNGYYPRREYFKKFSDAVSYIKSFKTGVILTSMDADDYLFQNLSNWKGYIYIKARKDVVKALKDIGLTCLVDESWVLEKDPKLAILSAYIKEFSSIGGSGYETLKRMMTTLPENGIKEDFWKACKLYEKSDSYVRNAARQVTPDPYTIWVCQKIKKYLRDYVNAESTVRQEGCVDSIFTIGVILRKKLYRISGESYNKFKNNYLIKVLCKK